MWAHWHNVANNIEPSVCGGDAALCQISLTTFVTADTKEEILSPTVQTNSSLYRTRLAVAGLGHLEASVTYHLSHCMIALAHAFVCLLKPRLHDTTGCHTGCQTGCTTRFDNRLNEQWLFVQHGCQTGCKTGCATGLTTGLTTGCIV